MRDAIGSLRQSGRGSSGLDAGEADHAALYDLVEERMAEGHRPDGTTAFDFSARGSSYDRADKIQWIYEDAAPPINSAMSKSARSVLHTLHQIVRKAVEEAGGQFRAAAPLVE